MSSLVFNFHDPNNIETRFLKKIFPILKENFDKAFVSLTYKTVVMNSDALDFFKGDSFFEVNINSENSLIGDHFVEGFKNAVKHTSPDQILHLCASDRLAFALLNYKKNYLNDISKVNTPTLFHRSEKAWLTHPKNYYAAESMVTRVGEILFGRSLDFAWCHITLTSKQLSNILPKLTAKDLVIFAQVTYELKEVLKIKEVDWLSWEDPFIFGKDPQKYKLERENSSAEPEKRMNYVLPQIKYLFEEYKKVKNKV